MTAEKVNPVTSDIARVALLHEEPIMSPRGRLIQTIKDGRDAIQNGHFALGSERFIAKAWAFSRGWIISPPTLEPRTGEGNTSIELWVGHRENDHLISIGGRITSPETEQNKPLCELEVVKMRLSGDGISDARLEQHAVYMMGIEGAETGETVLAGGHTDFTDFDLITTFINLASPQQSPSIHPAIQDMIGCIMRRSSSGNLREVILKMSEAGTSIALRQHSTTRYNRDYNPSAA